MYILKTESCFDSAHFLAGYRGKCSNLHGHRWRVVAEISAEELEKAGQTRGMVLDFGDFKRDLAELADYFDHVLIAEDGSLKESTVEALRSENFRILFVPFRPTAENLARLFYEKLEEKGYRVERTEVYETPENCAVYTGERDWEHGES